MMEVKEVKMEVKEVKEVMWPMATEVKGQYLWMLEKESSLPIQSSFGSSFGRRTGDSAPKCYRPLTSLTSFFRDYNRALVLKHPRTSLTSSITLEKTNSENKK